MGAGRSQRAARRVGAAIGPGPEPHSGLRWNGWWSARKRQVPCRFWDAARGQETEKVATAGQRGGGASAASVPRGGAESEEEPTAGPTAGRQRPPRVPATASRPASLGVRGLSVSPPPRRFCRPVSSVFVACFRVFRSLALSLPPHPGLRLPSLGHSPALLCPRPEGCPAPSCAPREMEEPGSREGERGCDTAEIPQKGHCECGDRFGGTVWAWEVQSGGEY